MSGQAQKSWSLNDSADLLGRTKDLLQAAARAQRIRGVLCITVGFLRQSRTTFAKFDRYPDTNGAKS